LQIVQLDSQSKQFFNPGIFGCYFSYDDSKKCAESMC